MFSRNHCDAILKTTVANGPLQYCATKDTTTGTIYLNLVNPDSTAEQVEIKLSSNVAPEATAITLSAPANSDSNSIDDPTHVVPIETKLSDIKPDFTHTFPAYSVTILKLKNIN
jgi:alpha-N-arabinofuranosidase